MILPILGKLERPLPLPESISRPVIAAAADRCLPAPPPSRWRRHDARAPFTSLAARSHWPLLAAAPALAQDEAPTPPAQNWSFDGLFGTYDLAAAQRGFQVYSEVCSVCHSMKHLHYRDLAGIGLTEDQIKAIAAAVTVPQGLNDQGEPNDGPATPADPVQVAVRQRAGGARRATTARCRPTCR